MSTSLGLDGELFGNKGGGGGGKEAVVLGLPPRLLFPEKRQSIKASFDLTASPTG